MVTSREKDSQERVAWQFRWWWGWFSPRPPTTCPWRACLIPFLLHYTVGRLYSQLDSAGFNNLPQ